MEHMLTDGGKNHRYKILYDDGQTNVDDLELVPFRLITGTKISIYMKDCSEYYPAFIMEHNPYEEKDDGMGIRGQFVYTIQYEESDVTETLDLSNEKFKIVGMPSTVAEQQSREEVSAESMLKDDGSLDTVSDKHLTTTNLGTSSSDQDDDDNEDDVSMSPDDEAEDERGAVGLLKDDGAHEIDDAKHRFLSNIQIQAGKTKLEVYFLDDDDDKTSGNYYPGVLAEHKPKNGQKYRYRILYDDGMDHTDDVEKERFRLLTGTKVSIHLKNYDKWYPAFITEHNPCEAWGDNDDGITGQYVYTIQFVISGVSETLDLSNETFKIMDMPPFGFTSLVGTRQSMRNQIGMKTAPDAFLGHNIDNVCYEISWPSIEGETWRPFITDLEKIAFYSCSFKTNTCEVEWNSNGYVYETKFRPMERRKRKKVDLTIKEEAKVVAPRKRLAPTEKRHSATKGKKVSTTTKSPATKAPATKVNPPIFNEQEKHIITDTLNTTHEEILNNLPHFKMIHDCCFVLWKGIYRPALILAPFDIEKGNIVNTWIARYRAYVRGSISDMPYLIYWYENGCNDKSFSLVKGQDVFSIEEGMKKGWDCPFSDKMSDPITYGTLTPEEDAVNHGIGLMMEDNEKPKAERGG